jgi:TPR repeat protein
MSNKGADLFKIADHYQIEGDFENALKYYKLSAAKGNSSAYIVLGYTLLERGNHFRAKESFDAAGISAHAIYGLTLCQFEASSTKKAIMENLIQTQKHTMAAPVYMLHRMYNGSIEDIRILGESLSDDPNRLLRYAVDAGHINAIHEMGIKYYEVENYPKAIEMFTQTAFNGYIPAFVSLGYYLLDVFNDAQGAKKCFMIAIKYGSFDAYAGLGDYYNKLLNVPNSCANARDHFYQIGIKNKNTLCMFRANCVAIYHVFNRKTKNEAIEKLQVAVNDNHIPSMLELIRYWEIHTNKFQHPAMNLYRQAIKLDSVKAMFMYGEYHLNGLIDGDITDQENIALTYLNLAAERGMIRAHMLLADYYEHKLDADEYNAGQMDFCHKMIIEHLTIASNADCIGAAQRLENINECQ